VAGFVWPRQPPRVYGIIDTGYVSSEEIETVARELLAGGVDIIQLRAKNESQAERASLLERLLPFCQDTAAPLVVNDDVELAARFGLGLHVGQDDLAPEAARERIGPNVPLGWSTHSEAQARAAIDRAALLDYFAVGPVFATGTKPDYPPVGLGLVETVARMQPPLPWFCIGGINLTNCADVVAASASGLVSVSAVLKSSDRSEPVRALRAAFASAGPAR